MRLPAAGQVVLAGSFSPVNPNALGVWTSGDYLVTTDMNGVLPRGNTPLVTNDSTGTTTALNPPCDVDGLGPPWVLMSCPLTSNPYGAYDVELYSLTDGTSQTVTPSSGVPFCPSPPPDVETECASANAVGTYWIRWDASCYNCGHTYLFQNIETGELRDDPTTATTFADLNSPSLSQSTCPGVQVMPNLMGGGTVWGSLTPEGQFAIATATPGEVFLERCGTTMRRLLTSPATEDSYAAAWNAGAIVWQTVPTELSGLLLPSLQTFTIPLPSGIAEPQGSTQEVPVLALALTSDGLYVRDGWTGTLWRTASPTALPLNTSRPGLTRSGSKLICGHGSWRDADRFSYAWLVDGTQTKVAKPRLDVGKAGKRRNVSCRVTAFNAAGTTTASSRTLRVR